MNETIRTLRERRSVRSFLSDPIPENILDAILEAGTWAATGLNKQSPVMVVVRDKETIDYMERLNAAVMGQSGTHPFYGAPVVVVVLADGDNYNWLRDGSLVMGNLMNAAHSLGVGSCWINRAQEVFDTPEGKEWHETISAQFADLGKLQSFPLQDSALIGEMGHFERKTP